MKIRASHTHQRGFTLTEAMLSLTVLTSGLLALAQFQGDLNRQSGATRSQAKAIDLAQQKLEELRLVALVDANALTDGSDRVAADPGDSTRFDRHWTVQSHAALGYADVEIRTEWSTADGEHRTAGVTSILTGGRPYQAGNGVGRELTPEAEAPHPELAMAAAPGATASVTAPPAPRVLLATCICAIDGLTGRASLDSRNANPACSSACCERERPESGAPLCSRESCPFIAQCRSSR